eukprot:SAG11_NODE_725_length_7518_cov_3.706025_2_plen_473_part_00
MLCPLLIFAMMENTKNNAAIPPAFNWSHFPHFSWRARVTGISDGRAVPSTTHFTIASNSTSANGTAWSPAVVFDNASIASVAGSYTNSVLLAGKGSYDELAGDKFDLLNFVLSAGDIPHVGGSWGHWNETLEVDLELEVTFSGEESPLVHHMTAWRGGVCANDCECRIGLLLGRDASNGPELFTFREYNQEKYFTHFESLPQLSKFPKKIMVIDDFCSDTESGSWRDGIHNLRKLGLRAMRLCPGNPVSTAIESEIRLIKKKATSEQITAGGGFGPLPSRGNDWAPQDSAIALYANNSTARMAVEAQKVAEYTAAGYTAADVTLANMADEPYLGGGLGGGLGPLPPIGNSSFPRATETWLRFLREQGLSPSQFGVSSWDKVMPSGMPTGTTASVARIRGSLCGRFISSAQVVLTHFLQYLGLAGVEPSRAARARYYWTLRFMAWFPTLEYAQATKMSREAFSPGIYTYANVS